MKNMLVLAMGSLREAMRDRILYGLMGSGALLLLILAMVSPMTLGARDKTFHDAGLAWLHVSGFLTILILGAWSLHRERERGIWLSILTRPVSRSEYLLGRISGLLAVLAVTLIAVGLVYLGLGWATGVAPLTGLPIVLLYVFLEMSILAGLILLFSTFTGFAMTVLLGLLLFTAGHMATDLLRFAAMVDSAPVTAMATGLHWLLPHLEIFRIRHAVVDGAAPALGDSLPVLGYSLLYLAALVSLSVAIFSRREIR